MVIWWCLSWTPGVLPAHGPERGGPRKPPRHFRCTTEESYVFHRILVAPRINRHCTCRPADLPPPNAGAVTDPTPLLFALARWPGGAGNSGVDWPGVRCVATFERPNERPASPHQPIGSRKGRQKGRESLFERGRGRGCGRASCWSWVCVSEPWRTSSWGRLRCCGSFGTAAAASRSTCSD